MRHFVVLGFKTTSGSEEGKLVHLGCDRGESIGVLKETGDGFARKQLYELAVPHITRHFDGKADLVSEPETTAPVEEVPKLSDGAQALADEHGLTEAQLLTIEPTGSTGNIIKADVEAFLLLQTGV